MVSLALVMEMEHQLGEQPDAHEQYADDEEGHPGEQGGPIADLVAGDPLDEHPDQEREPYGADDELWYCYHCGGNLAAIPEAPPEDEGSREDRVRT